MVNSATQAVKNANATKTNRPGMCQQQTRTWLGGGSAGDVDSDGDADAVDGWKSEPPRARHTDKRPAVGAPVAWSGGSGGFGHRALCVGYSGGKAQIRSTDAGGRGVVATKDIDWFEQHWGLHYLGWSETISGQSIPELKIQAPARPSAPKPKPKTRGKAVDAALKSLSTAKAKKGSPRERHIKNAVTELSEVPFIKQGSTK